MELGTEQSKSGMQIIEKKLPFESIIFKFDII